MIKNLFLSISLLSSFTFLVQYGLCSENQGLSKNIHNLPTNKLVFSSKDLNKLNYKTSASNYNISEKGTHSLKYITPKNN
ncbi:MAG: hypothetical protein WCK67_09175 [bacterium]